MMVEGSKKRERHRERERKKKREIQRKVEEWKSVKKRNSRFNILRI